MPDSNNRTECPMAAVYAVLVFLIVICMLNFMTNGRLD